jgi:hypothetical protein
MIRDARAGVLAEAALFAFASVLLAQMGLGVLIFLAPLQVLYMRRGGKVQAAAGTAVVVAIGAIRVIGAASRHTLDQTAGLLVVELAAVASLMLGLIVVNTLGTHPLPVLGRRLRAVPRLIAATLLAAAIYVPLAAALQARPGLGESVTGIFRTTAETIASVFAQGSKGVQAEGSVDVQALAARMYTLAMDVFPRSVMLYYFAILAFSWWAGARSATRVLGLRPYRLVTFALADAYVWPLIASLALVAADVAFGIGPVGYVAWNAGLIMLFLYALQGLGVVHFAFQRYNVGRALRLLVYVVLAVLFVSPRANLVVVIGLPALGVSEIWLRYRTRRRRSDANEGDS